MKEKLKKSNIILFLILILASGIILIPLFQGKYDIIKDDGIQHLYRIMGNRQAFKENIKNISIFPEFCNGFGYSWNLFYSPGTNILLFLLGFIKLRSIQILQIAITIITVMTTFSMYICTKRMTGNKYISAIAAIMYISVPYRLTDIYIRCAIAELASFIFIPIVFLGMYEIFSEKKKNTCALAIGSIGVILTHQIIGMYTAIFCMIYVLFNIKSLVNKDVIKNLCINGILIILTIAFYVAPLLEQKQVTEYEVFKSGRMEREEIMIYLKLNPIDLIYTKKNAKRVYELGYITLLGLLLTPFVYKKIDKRIKKIYIFFFIIGLMCEIMTLKIFPFEKLPEILKYIQFTFRLLTFSSYFLIFVSAVNIGLYLDKKISNYDVLMITIISYGILTIYTGFPSIESNIYTYDFQENVPVNYKTGRVHAGCASFEYLPSKAYENLNYIIERNKEIIVQQGKADIKDYKKENGVLEARLENVKENTILELPYIYYLGYQVEIESQENNQIKILDNFESDKGFVAIRFDDSIDECKIKVYYNGTQIQDISYIVSISGLVLLLIVYMYNKRYYKKIIKNIENGKDN